MLGVAAYFISVLDSDNLPKSAVVAELPVACLATIECGWSSALSQQPLTTELQTLLGLVKSREVS